MKWRKFRKNDNAVLGYFIAFIFSAVMLVFLFSFAIPFLINFTTDMYEAGDHIIELAEGNIENIRDETVKQRILDNLQRMQDSTEETIDYLGFFYQYSWILIILVVTLTIFMLARKVVETKGMQGVV